MTDLISYTDEQLIEELCWRGYRFEDFQIRTIAKQGAVSFLSDLKNNYGANLRQGWRRLRLWQVLLNSYPYPAAHDRIRAYVFEDYMTRDGIDERNTVAALVCQDNKSLQKTPFRIKNVWGVGYQLVRQNDDQNRGLIKRQI